MDDGTGNGTASKAALAKTEISLTLSSKFDMHDEDVDKSADLKALMVK